jgi:hypothetical protein
MDVSRDEILVVLIFVAPASIVARDAATGGYDRLRLPLVSWRGRRGGADLLDSEAAVSGPAMCRRLEMEGSEGFCSSTGGDGGDCGCRWYW